MDIGSSFLPSEVTAAFLWAQLEELDKIQNHRKEIWQTYYESLKNWADENEVKMPVIPKFATNNGHMFYLIFPTLELRTQFITYFKEKGILAVFHYLSLHRSDYYQNRYTGQPLTKSDHFANSLIRLPLFFGLKDEKLDKVMNTLIAF